MSNPISFSAITRLAQWLHVFFGVFAAFGNWDNVVDREVDLWLSKRTSGTSVIVALLDFLPFLCRERTFQLGFNKSALVETKHQTVMVTDVHSVVPPLGDRVAFSRVFATPFNLVSVVALTVIALPFYRSINGWLRVGFVPLLHTINCVFVSATRSALLRTTKESIASALLVKFSAPITFSI